MPKLMKSATLDARFTKAMEKVERAVEELNMVADDFRDLSDVKPVGSQVALLKRRCDDFKELQARFEELRGG